MSGIVMAVSRSGSHTFTKPNESRIRLVPGLGVEGDAHLGVTVQHCSDVRKNPDRPNLRQVHLIAAELHEELRAAGFPVSAGTSPPAASIFSRCRAAPGCTSATPPSSRSRAFARRAASWTASSRG
jgi:hypothetical protein